MRLPCGHYFHSKCIANHFRLCSTACPNCRDDPCGITWEDDYESDVDDHADGITLSAAMKMAKRDKQMPVMKRMFATKRKWQGIVRDKSREMKAHMAVLTPLEDKMFAEIRAYEEKKQATYDEKHKKRLAECDQLRKDISKARSQHRCASVRIAKKYGYESRTHRSVRRRVRDRVVGIMEDMEANH